MRMGSSLHTSRGCIAFLQQNMNYYIMTRSGNKRSSINTEEAWRTPIHISSEHKHARKRSKVFCMSKKTRTNS